MLYFDAQFSNLTFEFFLKHRNTLLDYNKANILIKKISGINNFFTAQNDASELLLLISENNEKIKEIDRREYGDFQTNLNLAAKVLEYANYQYADIEFVLEPTCGKGNFILASLYQYKFLKKIVGVEIYKPYVWETKFTILSFFLENKNYPKLEIDIIHGNAFDYSYENLANTTKNLKTLVVGNPPWVTNSELGVIESNNLPIKSNFKKFNGLEAMTGKGNFDIGEYISLLMIKSFQNHSGLFCFLIKNSVVKNIIYDQKTNMYAISNSQMMTIDSKKEFNVSVKASLFLTNLNKSADITCKELDFYSKHQITTFGWYKDKFVYSVNDYNKVRYIDGKSKFIWRSGMKHDCSKIMELEILNNKFSNGIGEHFNLEKELIYGLLKSSDLKGGQINEYRKVTIITQEKIGQDTNYIKQEYPLTYQYLHSHRALLKKRKSSIYKDKPDFSIFGIGNYSFAKYKIAISGLYKSTIFTLINPDKLKPIMLDDTCYFIGFENQEMARIAQYILNSTLIQNFLKAIIFTDAKRPINKDVLMRIDWIKAYSNLKFKDVNNTVQGITNKDWEVFGELLTSKNNEEAIGRKRYEPISMT